jgi:hypothetical protein
MIHLRLSTSQFLMPSNCDAGVVRKSARPGWRGMTIARIGGCP